jgi:hypothetical protein
MTGATNDHLPPTGRSPPHHHAFRASAASPAGPAGCDTAGTMTFLVMKIPFRRVVT